MVTRQFSRPPKTEKRFLGSDKSALPMVGVTVARENQFE